MCIALAIGGAALLATGTAIYEGNKQAGIAGQQLQLAQGQTGKQDQSFAQLQQLISDPSSFFSNPVYTAAANQGGAQVARQNAAAFGPNSGNEATALQAYGQTFGQQQFLQQENLLAGLSGAQFNPASAGQAASGAYGAAAGSLNNLSGLLAFFGTSGGGGAGAGAQATPDLTGLAPPGYGY